MLLHMGRDKTAEVIRSLQGCVLGSMLCSVYVTDKHYTPAQQAALRAHGGDEFQKSANRHVGVGRRALGQVADRGLRLELLLDHVVAAHGDPALGRGEEAGDHFHGG